MCGRFTLITDGETLKERFKLYRFEDLPMNKRYNIAPTQDILAVIHDGKGNKAGYLRWGLIPSWTKNKTVSRPIINARAETVDEKPSFMKLLARRRCLILADGFYEWKKDNQEKRPYHIRLKNQQPFAFAGLWDRWEKEGEIITSCTIITTTANKTMDQLHHRMPVILREEDESIWLDRSVTDLAMLKQLLTPYPEDEMEAYEVSAIVNSAKVDTPACIQSINQHNP